MGLVLGWLCSHICIFHELQSTEDKWRIVVEKDELRAYGSRRRNKKEKAHKRSVLGFTFCKRKLRFDFWVRFFFFNKAIRGQFYFSFENQVN